MSSADEELAEMTRDRDHYQAELEKAMKVINSKNRTAEAEKPSNGQTAEQEAPEVSPLVVEAKNRIKSIKAGIANVQQEMQRFAAEYQQREAIVKELQGELARWEKAIGA